MWNLGRASAECKLNKFKKYEGETSDFFRFVGFTLLRPYGTTKIGLSPIENDVSLEDEVADEGDVDADAGSSGVDDDGRG